MVTPLGSTHRNSQIPKHNDDPQNARRVASRYLSLSTTSSSSNSSSSTNTTLSSIRSSSPILGNKSAVSTPKGQQRAVSTERRRPPPSNAERMLLTSMRTLSVSFQGESYALPLSKVKPPPTAVGTPGGSSKGTPERRKAGVTPMRDLKDRDRENARPSDQQQQRWPGSLRGQNSSLLTRSLDYGAGRPQSVGSGSSLKELRKPVADETSRNKAGAESKLQHNDDAFRRSSSLNRRSNLGDSMNSNVQRLSSGSSSSGKATHPRGKSRGLVMPERLHQDSGNRMHKSLDPELSLPSDGTIGPSKSFTATKLQNSSPLSSSREVFPARGLSPLRGFVRTASPSKAMNSPSSAKSRGVSSTLRARSGEGISVTDKSNCSTPSIFRFGVDARKGQLDENRIADAHYLRLLHNRLLQWRLANAKLENTRLVQKHTAERSLYNAWVTTSNLQHSVGTKRIELQLLNHNLKIYHILKDQEPHLKCWALFDRDHCNSVSRAIEALKASTLRLPIVGNAKADARNVQEAISSAVDVMQTMASSVCPLFSKVEQMNSLVSEFSNASARQHLLLDKYNELLSTTFIPLQVTRCSLTTHVLQQVQQQPTKPV